MVSMNGVSVMASLYVGRVLLPPQKNPAAFWLRDFSYTNSHHTRYRWSMTATWALVAWLRGDRVVGVVPEMIPWPTAQAMGSTA